MAALVAGILIVAATASAGDFLWYHFGIRHRMMAGLVHGALLLTVVGGVIGRSSGHLVKGLPIGALAGIGGAASYYAVIAVFGGRTYGAAIPAAWIILWVLLALLDGRWIRRPPRSAKGIAVRALVAATLSGLSFALVMNRLWGRPSSDGRNYLLQFVLWTIAWAPGLFILMAGGAEARKAIPRDDRRTDAPEASDPSPHDTLGTSITGAELMARLDRGEAVGILDVRSEAEFAAGHVPGAVNVPFNHVAARLQEVPGAEADELIVYCGHGPRAYVAAVPLRRAGRRVVYLKGHWSAWRAEHRPIEH